VGVGRELETGVTDVTGAGFLSDFTVNNPSAAMTTMKAEIAKSFILLFDRGCLSM
jgi:hypothetical protein